MTDRPAPLEYNRRWPMKLWLAGVFFFLYSPLIALIAFSFNDSKRNIVWRGFTLDYYAKLFKNDELMLAFANSLTIALITTLISLVLGALAAIMLWRFRFPFKGAVEGALSLPIVVPEIGWCRFWRTARVTWSPNLSSLVSTWMRPTQRRSYFQMTRTRRRARR